MKRLFGILILGALVAFVTAQTPTGIPPAYISGPKTITSSTPLTITALGGFSTCTLDFTGVTAGSATVTVKGEITSTNASTLTSLDNHATITSDGVYVYQFPYNTINVTTTAGTVTLNFTCQQSVARVGAGFFPSPPPSPATGFVIVQPSNPPATIQPGYSGLTGAVYSGGIGVDNNPAQASGLTCGVVNTTNCFIQVAGGSTTTKGIIINYDTACNAAGNTLASISVQNVTEFTVKCNGNTVATGNFTAAGGSASIPWHGTFSCSLTAGANTSCGSLTVVSGNVCTATYTDSTQAGGTVHTLAVALSGTTLTVKAYSSSALDTSAVTGNVDCL